MKALAQSASTKKKLNNAGKKSKKKEEKENLQNYMLEVFKATSPYNTGPRL